MGGSKSRAIAPKPSRPQAIRRVWWWLGVSATIVLPGTGISMMLVYAGITTAAAVTLGGGVAGLLALGTGLWARLRYSLWLPQPWQEVGVAVLWSAAFATAACVVVITVFRASVPVGLVAGLGLGTAMFFRYRRLVSTSIREQLRRRIVQAPALAGAERQVALCRQELEKSPHDPASQLLLQLNLAWALAQCTLLADQPEGLDEALHFVRGVLEQPELDATLRWYAASILVDIEDIQTARQGDDSGYADAVRLLVDLAEQVSPTIATKYTDRARTDIVAERAEHALYLATQPGIPESAMLDYLNQAEALFERALTFARPGSEMQVSLHSRLALSKAMPFQSDSDLQTGVDLARKALAMAGFRYRDTREMAR